MSLYEQVSYVTESHPWFWQLMVFIFGACVGSFLNVVIYRLPKKESIVSPPSHNAQGDPIAWYDNLPIISYLLLRGRDRKTGEPYSPRYLIVELLTALLFLACWSLLYEQNMTQALAGLLFIGLLVPASFIDMDTMELPDFFTVGGAVLGTLLAFIFPALHDSFAPNQHWLVAAIPATMDAVLGVLIGSGTVLWFMILAETILRKEAMGFGDVLLMGCIGAFCGWQGALFALFGGACLGTLVVIPLMILEKGFGIRISLGQRSAPPSDEADEAPKSDKAAKDKQDGSGDSGDEEAELGFGASLPFGPWLALGALVYYIYARDLVDGYFAMLQSAFLGG